MYLHISSEQLHARHIVWHGNTDWEALHTDTVMIWLCHVCLLSFNTFHICVSMFASNKLCTQTRTLRDCVGANFLQKCTLWLPTHRWKRHQHKRFVYVIFRFRRIHVKSSYHSPWAHEVPWIIENEAMVSFCRHWIWSSSTRKVEMDEGHHYMLWIEWNLHRSLCTKLASYQPVTLYRTGNTCLFFLVFGSYWNYRQNSAVQSDDGAINDSSVFGISACEEMHFRTMLSNYMGSNL